ncbi:hypothetical protein KI387_001610 [Taxus chinensis]|uniref:Uncharacterized protein n=1 Tax=Taxus chinensis TaxID=29808 RepID=A0AA38GVC1_TAXCH|nr:hypothetical protein KI387_001610 [Taxus chinensis]
MLKQMKLLQRVLDSGFINGEMKVVNLTWKKLDQILKAVLGSKLDVSAQMSSLLLQENEFIVLIPFTKKQRPNSISISGMNLKLDITEKDCKQSVNSESCDRLQSCCKGSISRESICESSGNHSLAIADNAWHDIISDIALLNTSSNILHDEQSSASAKSVLGKRNELHDNDKADESRPVDLSLNSFRFYELRNGKKHKDPDNKR